MSRLTKVQTRAIELLRERVNFERASFGFSPTARKQIAAHESNSGMSNGVDTEAIREATRLYRAAWITPLIDALLAGDTGVLRNMLR
jgi:hypothetical protein